MHQSSSPTQLVTAVRCNRDGVFFLGTRRCLTLSWAEREHVRKVALLGLACIPFCRRRYLCTFRSVFSKASASWSLASTCSRHLCYSPIQRSAFKTIARPGGLQSHGTARWREKRSILSIDLHWVRRRHRPSPRCCRRLGQVDTASSRIQMLFVGEHDLWTHTAYCGSKSMRTCAAHLR